MILATIKSIPTRFFIIFIGIIIFIHLIVLALVTQQHKLVKHQATKAALIQQVINIIHMVQATSVSELNNAIQALDEPNIIVKLTIKPIWHQQFKSITFWHITEYVRSHPSNHIKFSLRLKDGRWLNIEANISSSGLWSQLFLLGIEILITIIVLFYAHSISRFIYPLKEFQHAAERLGIDLRATPLEEFKGPRVVRETAQAMNRMQQRIRDLLDDRTLLLAAISHDLRTPITRLKLRANKINDIELYNKTINDLNEMESMIAEILDFARKDLTSEHKTKFDFHSFLQSICDELLDVHYPIVFISTCKRIPYSGRPLALKRAINNIIQNAIKYGHCARVQLSQNNKQIIVTIDDDGPGIPPEKIDLVFAPFYRCDQSRSQSIAGIGLGLTIAKEVITAHKGTIQMINRPAGGLRVTIIL